MGLACVGRDRQVITAVLADVDRGREPLVAELGRHDLGVELGELLEAHVLFREERAVHPIQDVPLGLQGRGELGDLHLPYPVLGPDQTQSDLHLCSSLSVSNGPDVPPWTFDFEKVNLGGGGL